MQYQDYTIFNQLHVEGKTLFVKVINNVMLTVYEATLMKNNCKYKLETIKNILDNCLINKEINIKINIFSKQLQIICLYKTEIIDLEFEFGLDEVEIKNIQSLDLNRQISDLRSQIKIYEEQTPIVFRCNNTNAILNDSSMAGQTPVSYSFYNKAMLICNGQHISRITAFIDKPENNLIAKTTERYNKIRPYMRSSASFFTKYHGQQIIIPPRKILKVWQYDNLKPKIYTCGIHEGINLGVLFWCGIEEKKDEVPDEFKLHELSGF